LNPPVFLTGPEPLSAQVAAHLLAGRSGTPPDLGDTLIIVPTAGAARAIRAELAHQSCGVLSPRFRLPMEALLPDDIKTATSLERLAAWVKVLQETSRAKFASLIPSAVKLSTPEDWIGVATRLIGVGNTLAEAGLDPSSARLPELCPQDSPRWQEFGKLYITYRQMLERAGRPDPNAVRVQQSVKPSLAPHLRRIVVAAVPDLPTITIEWLTAAQGQGIAVEILCATAVDKDARLDPWGRPDQEWWATHPVQVPEVLLVIENDVDGEASALLEFAARHGQKGFSLVSAAPESTNALEAEVVLRGAVPYLPEGRSLAQTEAATILTLWDDFLRHQSLRTLRPLLQLPVFAELLLAGSDLVADEAATACDRLLVEKLCQSLDAARDWSAAWQSSDHADTEQLRRFIALLDNFTGRKLQGRELLAALYKDVEDSEPSTASALESLIEALDDSASSPLLRDFPPDWQQALHRRQIEDRRLFIPATEGAVEILGWLEAPWSNSPVLCLAGCREGALPSGVSEDAFLPDAIRARLGLASQATRYARDAYLLSCLIRAHSPDRLRLGFSRFRPEGEPNRPSRLLFGCPDDELAERITKIFQPSPARPRVHQPSLAWHLHLEKPDPVTTIRVTGFKHYLECPLRFYLSQVKKLQPFDPDQREIGASDYGTLLHRVLENFHKDGPHDSTDEKLISAYLGKELDRVVARHYGRHPAPVVLVQTESMRVRLRHLAAVQAAERRAGWRLIESEYAVKKEDGFTIGPLALTGTMDRVETHEEHGLRVLDYKTFAKTQTPEDTHFGPPREDHELPEAAITRTDSRDRPVDKSWTDLQLPLYRRLAAKIWPDHAKKGLATGYLLLPGDSDDTQIALLGLDETTQSAAEVCATAIAERVGRGNFWPPAEKVRYDNFAEWFGGDDPRQIFDQASIAYLEGRP
jgi:ATP-dependent helicase/nuclease subunit B